MKEWLRAWYFKHKYRHFCKDLTYKDVKKIIDRLKELNKE